MIGISTKSSGFLLNNGSELHVYSITFVVPSGYAYVFIPSDVNYIAIIITFLFNVVACKFYFLNL